MEISIDNLFNAVKEYIKDEEQLNVINKAYLYAYSCHKDKSRKNGEGYISHPLNVAMILTDLNVDYITISAALLHETINHGGSSKEIIEDMFGHDIAMIVDAISKINKLSLSAFTIFLYPVELYCLSCLIFK